MLNVLWQSTNLSINICQIMSDFQRKLFQNKLAQAEKSLGLNFSQTADDDKDENDETLEDSFGGLAPLPSIRALGSHSLHNQNRLKAENDKAFVEKLPKWDDFFDCNHIYREPESGYCFQTYYSKPIVSETIEDTNNNPVVFVAHHGAGSSGLTFAKLTESLKRQSKLQGYNGTPGFFTFDMRGHGSTKRLNKDENENYSMSINQLCADFEFVLNKFFNQYFADNNVTPSLFFLGHSLGGAVLTKIVREEQRQLQSKGSLKSISIEMVTAMPLPENIFKCVKGLIMIDIVEDTAIKALSSMHAYLRGVPKSFPTMKSVIDWHISSGLLHNRKSAVISVPPLVYKPDASKQGSYFWVTDLSKTEQGWASWFTGLSSNFISISNSVSKMLILVNNDYLDKDLMIGQMQGRYQLMVFHNSQLQLKNTLTTQTKTICSENSDELGHFVHEDIPDKVSISLLEFIERNDYEDLGRSQNRAVSSKIDLLNKLNKKWGIRK